MVGSKLFITTEEMLELKEQEEDEFQKAYKEYATKQGLSLDPYDARHFYDYEALYRDTGEFKIDEEGHLPSKYKKPGHPREVVDGVNTITGKSVSGGGGGAGVIEKEPKFISTSEMLELKKKDVPETPTFDYLNNSIEENHKKYLKLEKELIEFDTSMVGIPQELQTSYVANYNKKITEFQKLVADIQSDVNKRDELIKNQNAQTTIKEIDISKTISDLKNQKYMSQVAEEVKRGNPLSGVVATFGMMLTKIPKQVASAVLKASRDMDVDIVNSGWEDKFIESAEKDIEEFTKEAKRLYGAGKFMGLSITDLAEMPQNLGYSLTSMASGLAVGIPLASVPLPGFRVGAYIAGTAAAGGVAFRATRYEIMKTYLELKNEESITKTGKGINEHQQERFKEEFIDLASEYALWEAVPEAISNLTFFSVLTAPLTKMVGKTVAGKIVNKIAAMYGGEMITEAITTMAQTKVEVKAGIRGIEDMTEWLSMKDWIKAFKEVAPATFLQTTLMGGAGSAIISGKEAFRRTEASLKEEVGNSPIYDKLLAAAKIQLKDLGFLPEDMVAYGYEVEKPDDIKDVEEKGPADVKKELAGRMGKEKIFLEEIEEGLGKKLDMEKPEDVKAALDFIKKPTEKVAEVKPEVKPEIPLEEAEPTPKEIRETFEKLDTTKNNKELFFEKYNKVYNETKKGFDKILDEKISDLKEEGYKGVEEGGLKKNEEGEVIGRIPRVSRNPKWYRDFFESNKKKPTMKDLRDIAIDHLRNGHTEDYGTIAPNSIFNKLEAQLESYEAMLGDIKEGDYSFKKSPQKLSNKLKDLAAENKVIAGQKEKIEALETEKKGGYIDMRKEAYAREEEEIKKGIKKGLEKEILSKEELKERQREMDRFYKAEEEYTGKIVKEEVRDIKEVKIKDIPKDELKVSNKLIQRIQIAIKNRGFTNKQASDIKMKHGGARHLTTKVKRMSIPMLQDVLKAVERARPRQIGHRVVITAKTEKKIQSLKDTLISKLQMDEKTYKDILKDVGVYKEAKYTDARNFITEEQGKKIIYRLIDEAVILKIVLPLQQAVAKNSTIKGEVDKIEGRIRKEGERRGKDPHELNSMRKYIQIMEKMMGSPIFTVYQDLMNAHLENKQSLSEFINSFEKDKDILKDEKALLRIEHYIASKTNLENKPEMPKDITPEEVTLAKKIEKVLEDYQAMARTEKFLDNLDRLDKMPQYKEYKKEIDKAKDIYESKGYDDLVEYMKTQKWGVIKSGYSPYQVISAKVREDKPKSTTFAKGNIKTRTDIEYSDQDKNIIQRLFAYKKSMDNLVVMRPKVRAFVTMINKNLNNFKDPKRVEENISTFLDELKGYNRANNWFDRGINRLYAQAMQVIIMPSVVLSGRNLLQNLAFGFDKSILANPLNKALTKEEINYLNTYLKQTEFMKADWFMVGEKPLPGLGWLTKLINKVGIYPYSDLANRHWAFWGKVNQVKRAFAKGTLKQKMSKAKFSDMELVEQKRALQLLAKDGEEAMVRYVARVFVDDIHFLYDRSQRSPAEMGRVGKWAGNLMLFPRAYWEMLHKQGGKMINKNIPIKERLRAFKVMANVIGGGLLVGAAFKAVTGRKDNPYDPLQLLAYEPGGLAIGVAEAATDIYVDIIKVMGGDWDALKDLATDLPHAADMFIPFYAYTVRAIEASTDSKNIDRLAIRRLIMLIDKEYEVRGGAYKLERRAMEKWQYFLSGAGIDIKIKEREKAKPKVPMGRIDFKKELTGARIDIRKEIGRIDLRKELGQ